LGKVRYVACPRCGKQVVWDQENPFRPFCSERCKIVDLGAWATEKYRVPVQEDREEPDAEKQGDNPGSER
jgi:endogenous inhibitor of DNA gyrase (YacG/DUF329 family)